MTPDETRDYVSAAVGNVWFKTQLLLYFIVAGAITVGCAYYIWGRGKNGTAAAENLRAGQLVSGSAPPAYVITTAQDGALLITWQLGKDMQYHGTVQRPTVPLARP